MPFSQSDEVYKTRKSEKKKLIWVNIKLSITCDKSVTYQMLLQYSTNCDQFLITKLTSVGYLYTTYLEASVIIVIIKLLVHSSS